MAMTNTVADHDTATIVAVKSFIVQDPISNLKHLKKVKSLMLIMFATPFYYCKYFFRVL
jgi:hypothetical protein